MIRYRKVTMISEIAPHAVYTTKEAQILLKISPRTIKRLLKNGLIRANKIGGQYRILGKELMRLLSPKLDKTTASYLNMKNKVASV